MSVPALYAQRIYKTFFKRILQMTLLLITPLAAVASYNLGFALGQKYFGQK